ncbi:MAG: hypothetical protein K2L42_04495 [Clostridia bacterium]|nr:hypothetical protein [Clostridia bacterium]
MKKRSGIAVAALGLGCAVLLSGCGGCASCNGSNKNIADFSSNWYANTAYKKIQPTFTLGNEAGFSSEKLTYTVSFDGSRATNKSYQVNYAPGVYSTEFYAAAFDKEAYAHADFKSGYPEAAPVVYCYKTLLDIKEVTFIMGEETRSFTGDKVETLSFFLSVQDRLQPLYTYTKIKSTTPAELQVNSIDSAYRQIDCEYTSYYSYDGNNAITLIKNGSEEKTRTLSGLENAENSVVDAAYLDIAARATKLNGNFSQTLSVNTPARGLQSFTLSGSSSTLTDEEKPAVKSLLEKNGLYNPPLDAEGKEADFVTAVSVNFNGEQSGVSQTYYFAAIANPRNNSGRATMLKQTAPLSFGLGTLNYTLNDIESTLWNK